MAAIKTIYIFKTIYCILFYVISGLVFWSVKKITLVDWLVNGSLPVQYEFFFGPVSFGGNIFELILMMFEKD